MPNGIHTESTFESAIIEHLTANGWHLGNASDFSRDLSFDEKAVLSFIQASQPKSGQNFRHIIRMTQRTNSSSAFSKNWI